MRLRFFPVFLLLLGSALTVKAQGLVPTGSGALGPYDRAPQPYQILGLTVNGIEDEGTQSFVLQSSGLIIGQEVTLPGDQSLAEAIRDIYALRLFSDVKIVEERQVGDGVYLVIEVKEEPRLRDYSFSGVKKRHREDLEEKIPLLKGSRVRPADLGRSEQVIEEFFREKGFLLAEVTSERTVAEDNSLIIDFAVEKGQKIEISEVVVTGNEQISDRKVTKRLKKTKPDAWWRFWKKSTFKEDDYEEDLNRLLTYYNENGYYDARIVQDTVFVDREGGEPGVVVQLQMHEGPQYHVRDVVWEGNTIYPEATLNEALGLEKGDVFNNSKMQANLFANSRSSDVASLYMNQGYMRFNVQPEILIAEGDSLDLYFDVFEGEVYEFGEISISGNSKTKEHVIRRELYTIPGQTFSRDAIQETIRRLSQLNYFDQASLGGGPGININEAEKAVDLTYNLDEVGSDQLELSGTYGRFGVVLQLRFTFNNFSAQDVFKKGAWKPLPSGDGQQFSVAIQTSGTAYQRYSIGYTEPWFRGKPQPVGFTVAHSRFSGDIFSRADTTGRGFRQTSANVFYQRRLKWPDDKFSGTLGVGYQHYNNVDFYSNNILPVGVSQEITARTGLSRNSVNNPLFPTSGSEMSLSLNVALPFPGTIQYHKWRFDNKWHVPLANKLTLSLGADYGYIGSLNGERVQFERFLVGGSPFDSQGYRDGFIGRDIVYMRGYPARVLGPRLNNDPVGGRILNKYTSELRWLAIQSQQLQAAPYLFLDAANTWDGFDTYDPTQLFRSAGLGARLFLPILGVLELTYGYNFDGFDPINSSHDGSRRWLFQFSLGQGF